MAALKVAGLTEPVIMDAVLVMDQVSEVVATLNRTGFKNASDKTLKQRTQSSECWFLWMTTGIRYVHVIALKNSCLARKGAFQIHPDDGV